MSLPSAHMPNRRLRAASMASHSSPRVIPDSSRDSLDGSSELSHGSLRGLSDLRNYSLISPANASGMREPTRSFVHRSFVGAQGMLTIYGTNAASNVLTYDKVQLTTPNLL